LIATIDQLDDEQINEVVDWQMTESPAAKVQHGNNSLSESLGTLYERLATLSRSDYGRNDYGQSPMRSRIRLEPNRPMVIPICEPFPDISSTPPPFQLETRHNVYMETYIRSIENNFGRWYRWGVTWNGYYRGNLGCYINPEMLDWNNYSYQIMDREIFENYSIIMGIDNGEIVTYLSH